MCLRLFRRHHMAITIAVLATLLWALFTPPSNPHKKPQKYIFKYLTSKERVHLEEEIKTIHVPIKCSDLLRYIQGLTFSFSLKHGFKYLKWTRYNALDLVSKYTALVMLPLIDFRLVHAYSVAYSVKWVCGSYESISHLQFLHLIETAAMNCCQLFIVSLAVLVYVSSVNFCVSYMENREFASKSFYHYYEVEEKKTLFFFC